MDMQNPMQVKKEKTIPWFGIIDMWYFLSLTIFESCTPEV